MLPQKIIQTYNIDFHYYADYTQLYVPLWLTPHGNVPTRKADSRASASAGVFSILEIHIRILIFTLEFLFLKTIRIYIRI